MIRDALLDQDPVLREIVARLVAVLQPARIYLFGSRARGMPDPRVITISWSWSIILLSRGTASRKRLFEPCAVFPLPWMSWFGTAQRLTLACI